MSAVETFEFQAEAKQLLDLMIHSVYSEKDVFLRELISNASDALDKLRLEALLNKDLDIDTSDLHIFLSVDPEKRTLSISDNGIGMSREDVVGLIGTIAKSGTREFLHNLKAGDKKDVTAELIGQFGVGFYSSFMVADKVELVTRKPGADEAIHWLSEGDGTYTIEPAERDAHGTTVTLHLKPEDSEDGLHDYTKTWQLRQLVKRYSDFINYPIRMDVERTESEKDADGKPIEGKTKTVVETETLNSMKALWARNQDEVEQEEYNQFYRHVSRDWNEPWKTIHLKAEGTFEYQSLLFLPTKAPMDMFMPDADRGLQLYVKRVFIMDNCEELLSPHLRFVKGVVDATDLSLNVSREILQKDRRIQQIKKRLERKLLDTLKESLDEDREGYEKFWNEFGKVLKEGLYHDHQNRDKLLESCLFRSTHGEGWTTLADYVSRMKEGQEAIYYLTGENREAVENSPHLEIFKSKGYEVLILTDSVDEIWLGVTHEFEDKKLQSAARGDLNLGSEDEQKAAKEEREKKQKELATFISWMQTKLEDQVKEVRLTDRLVDSPACLVGDTHDMSANLERLMKAMGQEVPKTKRILELNPKHPLVEKLHTGYEDKKDQPELARAAQLVYSLAVLAEGGELDEPANFSKQVAELLASTL
ncbi:MAG: molecular chaperone HtpG [Vulcanimicrobiota bacterium]